MEEKHSMTQKKRNKDSDKKVADALKIWRESEIVDKTRKEIKNEKPSFLF